MKVENFCYSQIIMMYIETSITSWTKIDLRSSTLHFMHILLNISRITPWFYEIYLAFETIENLIIYGASYREFMTLWILDKLFLLPLPSYDESREIFKHLIKEELTISFFLFLKRVWRSVKKLNSSEAHPLWWFRLAFNWWAKN